MVFSRLRRVFATALPLRPSTPERSRVYAIGDVHGRDDLLAEMTGLIERDCASAPGPCMMILLGDYVDRGPHSASVLERLASGQLPKPFRALRGNHEAMLLRFLAEPRFLGVWRSNGGLETLHSYGVDVSAALRGEGYEAAHRAFLAALPVAHRAFLEATELSATVGDYFFCHAGVRPGAALCAQSEDDLLWIRESFLSHKRSFGKIVVHGHTPVARPEARANRINIDTGAFATSILTCLVLEGEDRRFLSAVGSARRTHNPLRWSAVHALAAPNFETLTGSLASNGVQDASDEDDPVRP
jgi:serine/threonine protein phosphatase 1